jgi:hypothetical protein
MRGGGRPGIRGVRAHRRGYLSSVVYAFSTLPSEMESPVGSTLPFAEVGAFGAPATVTPACGPPGGPHARVRAASSPARPGASARRDCRGCRPLDGYARHLPRSISEISQSAPTRGAGHLPSAVRSRLTLHAPASRVPRARASRLTARAPPQRRALPFPSARRSSRTPASVCSRRARSRRMPSCPGARTAATR